jgi:hypothetical protein
MTFRDDLDAAAAHIAALEEQVADLRARTGIAKLEARCGALAAALEAEASTRGARLVACYGAPLLAAAVWAAGFAYVVGASEAGAWELFQLATAIGVAGTAFGWGRARATIVGAAVIAAKLAVLVAWGWGWWTPWESLLRQAVASPALRPEVFYFFWVAPLLTICVACGEGLVVWQLLRRADEARSSLIAGAALPAREA